MKSPFMLKNLEGGGQMKKMSFLAIKVLFRSLAHASLIFENIA